MATGYTTTMDRYKDHTIKLWFNDQQMYEAYNSDNMVDRYDAVFAEWELTPHVDGDRSFSIMLAQYLVATLSHRITAVEVTDQYGVGFLLPVFNVEGV